MEPTLPAESAATAQISPVVPWCRLAPTPQSFVIEIWAIFSQEQVNRTCIIQLLQNFNQRDL